MTSRETSLSGSYCSITDPDPPPDGLLDPLTLPEPLPEDDPEVENEDDPLDLLPDDPLLVEDHWLIDETPILRLENHRRVEGMSQHLSDAMQHLRVAKDDGRTMLRDRFVC